MSGYRVWVDGGRGGYVHYAEEGRGELRFWWEFIVNGAYIAIPGEAAWDAHWAEAGQAWAQGRRAEILARVVDEVRRQKAATADVRLHDRSIEFHF